MEGNETFWSVVDDAASDLIMQDLPGSLLVLSILGNIVLVALLVRCYRKGRHVSSN